MLDPFGFKRTATLTVHNRFKPFSSRRVERRVWMLQYSSPPDPRTKRRLASAKQAREELHRSRRYGAAMDRLVNVLQKLSFARDLDSVMATTRDAARDLADSDGAAFILREGDKCYYADENAIGPLWKGQRFPMTACLSGWVMTHAEAVAVPDIYKDPRIPIDAYRPTFVKSVVMVPIRRTAPIGAIRKYWATEHVPTPEELALLQALADTTAVALENVQLYQELQTKVQEVVTVNRELVRANEELERFTYICSHDMHEPARMTNSYATLLQDMHVDQLDKHGLKCLNFITVNAKRLQDMLEQIISFSRIGREAIALETVDCNAVLGEVLFEFAPVIQARRAQIRHEPLPVLRTNPTLMRMLFRNLISNALKFQQSGAIPEIVIDAAEIASGDAPHWRFRVRDNGIGIDPALHAQVFGIFQRIHRKEDYAGAAIGLSICKKFIELCGGSIDFEPAPDHGTIFSFTLR
jgi:signal transduction histidine kinase